MTGGPGENIALVQARIERRKAKEMYHDALGESWSMALLCGQLLEQREVLLDIAKKQLIRTRFKDRYDKGCWKCEICGGESPPELTAQGVLLESHEAENEPEDVDHGPDCPFTWADKDTILHGVGNASEENDAE